MEMFEKAVRLKLRFQASIGLITTEDLFDLSLIQLNNIGVAIKRQLKATEEESLIEVPTKQNEELQLKLDIILHIIKIKQEAAKEATDKKAKAVQRQKLLEILQNKKEQDLQGKSIEEIEKMIAEL